MRIYQKVLEIHRFFMELPRQILHDQSVHFEDAYGKHVSFNLEWVYSAEVSSPSVSISYW